MNHPEGWYCRVDWNEPQPTPPCKEQCEECREEDEYNRANWPDLYE
jgi:hypothetical protein